MNTGPDAPPEISAVLEYLSAQWVVAQDVSSRVATGGKAPLTTPIDQSRTDDPFYLTELQIFADETIAQNSEIVIHDLPLLAAEIILGNVDTSALQAALGPNGENELSTNPQVQLAIKSALTATTDSALGKEEGGVLFAASQICVKAFNKGIQGGTGYTGPTAFQKLSVYFQAFLRWFSSDATTITTNTDPTGSDTKADDTATQQEEERGAATSQNTNAGESTTDTGASTANLPVDTTGSEATNTDEGTGEIGTGSEAQNEAAAGGEGSGAAL